MAPALCKAPRHMQGFSLPQPVLPYSMLEAARYLYADIKHIKTFHSRANKLVWGDLAPWQESPQRQI
jgi:hypothetical protein